VSRQVQSTLVRLRVPHNGVPRGALGTVADVHGPRCLIRWLDRLPGHDAHEAPGGECWVDEGALQGVGMVILNVPDVEPDAASKLWVPGR
jgi:hypothetical protein